MDYVFCDTRFGDDGNSSEEGITSHRSEKKEDAVFALLKHLIKGKFNRKTRRWSKRRDQDVGREIMKRYGDLSDESYEELMTCLQIQRPKLHPRIVRAIQKEKSERYISS